MADTKISALTELTAPVSGDFVPIVDTSAGATKKVDFDRLNGERLAVNYATIQAAIDVGVGIVRVTEDTTITSAITVNAGVHLKLNPDVTIVNTADTDVVILAEFGQISGGALRNINASFSHAILKVEADANTFTSKLNRTFAGDLLLHGTDTASAGYGIHLYAIGDTSASWIQWAQFFNINIHNVSEGIRLEVQEDSGDIAYVNGNIFRGITMDWCNYGIRTITTGTGTPAINGNQFIGCQFQTREAWGVTPGTQKAIDFAEGSSHNDVQMEIWDWNKSPEAVAINNSSTSTIGNIFKCNGAFDTTLDDQDILINTSTPDTPRVFAVADLPTTRREGRIAYIETTGIKSLAVDSGAGGLFKGIGALLTYNATESFTLARNEIGAGVYWRGDGSAATVDFDLANIDCTPGEECIFRNLSNTYEISVTAESSNGFRVDGRTSPLGATITTVGSVTGDYVHIKCYANNYWTIIHHRGQWTDGSAFGFSDVETYTVASVPSAALYTGVTMYISNGAAGSPCTAVSDGTNWLRSDTLAAISAT